MRVLGLVPARGGSTRVPRKNLALLGGKTLVRRALETVLAAGSFEVVALSSDDDEILAEAAGLPVATLERPPELGSATARAYDVAVHALRALEGRGAFDALAIVQCTSPFTAPEDIRGAIDLLSQSGARSVVSVVQLESALHPAKLKVLEGRRLLPFLEEDRLTPSHELPSLWVRNGSIYASRREVIDEGRLVDEHDVLGYEMPQERSFDIDTERDLEFARFLLHRRG